MTSSPAASGTAEVLPAGRLDPRQRRQALQRMRDTQFDVVVVGGGVTGAGVALDAATRGLSVALVEMRDLAAGTSSRSGKLIHGGLRYLEQFNFGLVREALRERSLLLQRLCPHLVRPVRFVYPLQHRFWERPYIGAGMFLYDTMGGAGAVPRHRHHTRRGARRLAPSLRPDGLIGALTFYDATIDDARHTLFVARTAAAYGAEVATAAKVVGFLRNGDRVTGVRVRDLEADAEFDLRGREVINATGVWTEELQALVGDTASFRVTASKGVHIMVPRDRITSEVAILVRAEDSVVFIRPWGRHWLVGTTDTRWDLDLDHPSATRVDIDYLLRQVNRVLERPLTRDDVDGVYAGLRPLVAGKADASGATSKLSREHAVEMPVPGLTLIAGGKYTTYRVMAKDAVDLAAQDLGLDVPPSCTEQIPLLGAEGFPAQWNSRARIAAQSGLTMARVERLLYRYGSRIDDLLALLARFPDLGGPVEGAEEYLRVEAYYAAAAEGALHLDDVLTRRLHISIDTPDRGVQAAGPVAAVIAPVLGWDAETTRREVEHYRDRVAVEVASQEQTEDAAADAVRRGIRDPRLVAQER